MLIGEVARRSGVSARMLRHYDALGLVRPTGRTHGGYREYSDADVRRIFHVESLRTLGLSLRQIARALEDAEFAPAELVADLIRWTEERLERERELLERLRTIDASAPTGWLDVLRIVELVRGLDSTSAARRQQAVLNRPETVRAPAELLAAAALAEVDPHVAGALRWALARADGRGTAELIEGVRADDAGVRRRAVLALAELPTAPEATAALTVALNDPEPEVRRCAALRLAGPGVTEAVPTLVEMVVEGDNDVGAAEALGSVAADHHCTPEVVAALSDELAAPTTTSATRHPPGGARCMRISELAARTGTPAATLRRHGSAELLPASRTASGHRLCCEAVREAGSSSADPCRRSVAAGVPVRAASSEILMHRAPPRVAGSPVGSLSVGFQRTVPSSTFRNAEATRATSPASPRRS
ncbi:MerR family DNA-binding transcriptional regulator [Streptomyces sp. P38-E01]|uniref:MerR family DNA-binding transcriptional regulator n=1 Tax=Streptomyces tardus TaxID=2780544 RepID=A0A949JET6_9ACTN|nr:MerR family DNA-binding transcriptional regulator [Streptomyces tardus]MBU7597179.1 MerR family DNA-binding transcriptional regulator [Streptomyces tardus]